jgi:hypothetical protein
VWGNGLKDPNKFIMLAGHQIADKTQRSVQIISFAHSGAKLALHPEPDEPPSPSNGYVPLIADDKGLPPGDLNSSYPTTTEQADCAATYSNAEIVVLDGCINEVGATDIALPPIINHTSRQQIEQRVFENCSVPMRDALTKVRTSFPLATIIVVNYYQIVSPDSSVFRAVATGAPAGAPQNKGSSKKELERLANEQLKIEKMKGIAPESQNTDTLVLQSWSENSTAFLQNSEGCFKWAITAAPSDTLTNAGTDEDPVCAAPISPIPTPSPDVIAKGSRVYLATVLNLPEFAYGAKDKRLWSLPIHFLFWTIHGDDMYRIRRKLCKSHYEPGGTREVCEVNPIAHPNEDGAKAYACSIIFDSSLKCNPNQPGILDQAWALR